MVEKICRLCFETKSRPLAIFTARGIKLKIADIIRLHFSDEVTEDDALPKFVCADCWTKTENFHEFYNVVNDRKNVYLANDVKNEEPTPTFVEINCDSIDHEVLEIASEKLEPSVKIEQDESEEIVHTFDDSFHDDNSSNHDEKPQMKVEETAAVINSVIDERPNGQTKYDHEDLTKQIAAYPLSDLSCDFCEAIFVSFGEAKRHYLQLHNTRRGYIKCCKKRLRTRGHIIEHIQWHVNPETFKCEQCNKIFKNNRRLKVHSVRHEPENSRKFKCSKCSKRFQRKYLLTKHMDTVHSAIENSFECDICKSKLKLYSSLKLHMQQIHLRQFEQICDQCGKVCISKGVLRKHKRSHDEVNEKLECPQCSALMKNAYYLRAHILRIHKSGPANCPHCPKVSPTRNALAMHIRTMHTYKVHKCHMCDRECKSAVALTEHLATHTGQYLYNCVYCPKKFKSHSNMYQHFRESHPVEWSADRKTKPREIKRSKKTVSQPQD